MPSRRSSSQSTQMAGFTMEPARMGKSQGPMHFVAGHMPGHMPAIGSTADRTGFCAGMVRSKGSMPSPRTRSIVAACAAASRQTSCALPSPWEPTPLPPVMSFFKPGQSRSRCSVGAVSSCGHRGTALVSQRACAAVIKAPMRSAAFEASRSRERISTACAQTSWLISPSKVCNARSLSSLGKGYAALRHFKISFVSFPAQRSTITRCRVAATRTRSVSIRSLSKVIFVTRRPKATHWSRRPQREGVLTSPR
mmetsp:Transcript_90294/g.260189  ORF Transcript_90294/g.260189 Transcript_90294/m.260189 type:complete len:252 (+) Transcript_90294:271-1026(+)